MTKIEALELELAARKLVEGTELGWWKVVRRDYMSVKSTFSNPPQFELYQLSPIELALGIIEGKPAWKGDEAYWTDLRGTTHKLTVADGCNLTVHGWSWNPPTLPYMNAYIRKNGAEIQSGQDRQRWAEGLILQMASSHNGRNSWLLNYGVSDEAKELRKDHPSKPKWNDYYHSAETIGSSAPTPKTVMVELMVEDVKWMAAAFNSPNPGSPSKIASACRKALENLK